MQSRRRATRHPAGWRGAVLIEGDRQNVEWRECRVLDTSMLGIGITFHDHRTTELIGLTVSVEMPAEANALSVRLEGVVRNALAVRYGIVRVGIEFNGMTPAECAIAVVLGALTDIDAEAIPESSASTRGPTGPLLPLRWDDRYRTVPSC